MEALISELHYPSAGKFVRIALLPSLRLAGWPCVHECGIVRPLLDLLKVLRGGMK